MDEDIWDVRFNLKARDNLEQYSCKLEITFLSLLALIETEGYGINDNMYYARERI